MSDALGDLLAKRRGNEPEEFMIIREFVTERFNTTPKLSVAQKNIIITMPNSAAAGSLRLVLYDLEEMCGSNYRLAIRIG